ncbi:SDR family oxidoreductase, partial [Clostridioides difficile]|nr:SDR family oxidoreductase [Clostridioides difficile]
AEQATPLGRIAEPDDVAALIAFLLSDAARQITGPVVHVDGGLTR